MYETNIFKEIKDYLKPQEVAEYYISEKGKYSGSNVFYKSPFRNEKTASFCVNNEKGFHDYGNGWHGDIISFVQKLYNLLPIDAAKTIIKDFALPININQRTSYKQIKFLRNRSLLNKKIRDGLDNWFNNTYIKLCDANKENKICIGILVKSMTDLENDNTLQALQYLYTEQIIINLWIDEFINTVTEDEKIDLFRHRKEIERICQ